jgi:hypothetical protein
MIEAARLRNGPKHNEYGWIRPETPPGSTRTRLEDVLIHDLADASEQAADDAAGAAYRIEPMTYSYEAHPPCTAPSTQVRLHWSARVRHGIVVHPRPPSTSAWLTPWLITPASSPDEATAAISEFVTPPGATEGLRGFTGHADQR